MADPVSAPRFSISVPPAEVGTALAAIEDFDCEYLDAIPLIGRIGLGHLLLAPCVTKASVDEVAAAIGKLEIHLLKATPSGCVSKSPARKLCLPTMSSLPGPGGSMRAVKQALDPNNVLRGRETF